MTDTKISQMLVDGYKPTIYVPGIDLSLTTGNQNVKVALSSIVAAAQQQLGLQVQQQLGISIPIGGTTAVQLYTPVSGDTNDVAILSLEIKLATIAGGTYNFQIFAGNPNINGTLLYDNAAQLSTEINIPDYLSQVPFIIPYSSGTNVPWIKIINVGSNALLANIQVVVAEFSGGLPVLAGFIPPTPYTGPLLSSVHVGPSEQFIEPIYALAALADGGTMYIDAGTYYLPFGLASISDSSPLDGANVNQSLAGKWNTLNIIGNGAYSTYFNGRGGYGSGPTHPYQLRSGKGFCYSHVPISISGVSFIYCGGLDKVGNGEAGIYLEEFASLATAQISNCSFDGNENGMFSPTWQTAGAGNNVNISITNCDFGYFKSNGQSQDGLSHDFYLQNQLTTVINSNFYGNKYGNCLKSTGATLNVSGGYVQHIGDRCIDYPNGGVLTVTGTTLTAASNCIPNFLGYANENQDNQQINPVFTNCDIIGTRFDDAIWVGNNTIVMQFVNTTQSWYNYGVPPSFEIEGIGGIPDSTRVTGLITSIPSGSAYLPTPPAIPSSISNPTNAALITAIPLI